MSPDVTDAIARTGAMRTPEVLLAEAQRLRAEAAALEAQVAERGGGSARRSWADVLHGDWTALGDEAGRVETSDTAGWRQIGRASALRAVLSALVGNESASRSAAVRAETIASSDQDVEVGVSMARAVTSLASGNQGAAFATLADLFERRRESALRGGAGGLLAEAAVLARREQDARRWFRPDVDAEGTGAAVDEESRLAAALLAPDRVEAAMRSLLDSDALRLPFTRARLHLALGMRLRRHHSPTEAVRHVQVALDHFSELGAQPWIRAARSELRAGGVRQRQTEDVSLSEQQMRIAVLAARGLSNREIGEQLYLSPRTVGSHLYRIYPKLGVSSRHQLAGWLAATARRASLRPLEVAS